MKAKGSLTKQEAEIEVSNDEIKSFFDGIIPDFVKEGGGILTDTVRLWRFQNQVRIIKKTKEIIEESNLDKQQVPLKVLYPLLESSSLEEDASMQSRWSNLLANAIVGTVNIAPNYIEILKEISSLEALVLDKVFDETEAGKKQGGKDTLQFSKQKICEYLKIPPEQGDLMIQNFFRLGLCREPGSTGMMVGEARVALRTTEIFELTSLGFTFVKACRTPIAK